jgi:glycerol-3-phosphate acyltransferase PlsY
MSDLATSLLAPPAITAWWSWLVLPAAYLLGSVSPAWCAGRINGKDLRQHGSGHLGATNAGRVLGAKWFAIVFAADVLKGALPVVAAHLLPAADADRPWLLLAAGASAVLGHVFTCFHGFKGGKAVATSLGLLAALVWPVALVSLGAWLVAWTVGWMAFGLGKSGAVGQASVIAALVTPAARLLLPGSPWSADQAPITGFLILLSVLVVVKHKSNIQKLFAAKS